MSTFGLVVVVIGDFGEARYDHHSVARYDHHSVARSDLGPRRIRWGDDRRHESRKELARSFLTNFIFLDDCHDSF